MSRERIEALVRDLLQVDPEAEVPADQLPLAVPPFGQPEVVEAIEALLQGRLTMGERVLEFERAYAEHTGTSHAVMVNSGSSALLVMLGALIETGRLSRGDGATFTSGLGACCVRGGTAAASRAWRA